MVFEKIREIIAEQTGKDVEEITLETNVKEDLDADSLDLFQIINDIEDEFDVSVEDPESIVTVQDAVDFVEKNQKFRLCRRRDFRCRQSRLCNYGGRHENSIYV